MSPDLQTKLVMLVVGVLFKVFLGFVLETAGWVEVGLVPGG